MQWTAGGAIQEVCKTPSASSERQDGEPRPRAEYWKFGIYYASSYSCRLAVSGLLFAKPSYQPASTSPPHLAHLI